MKIDWDHVEETDTTLENWSATVNGVGLNIVNLQPHNALPERAYSWTNQLTGVDWDYGFAETLDKAMEDAVQSVLDLAQRTEETNA